jgi:polysaccharide biosynthesis protein PelE
VTDLAPSALEQWDVLYLVGIHVVLSIGVGVAGIALYRRGERRPLLLLFIISVAAFGPFGLAGVSLARLLQCLFARHARPFEEWYASLFPPRESDRVRSIHDLIVLRQAGPTNTSSLAPFADVLALGTINQKQSTVSLIADHFRPSFALALHCALNDAEPTIRVQAATAVSRLEGQFAERQAALYQRLASRPSDPALLLAVVEHYADYAESGLLDVGRADEARRKALALAQEGTRLDLTDPRSFEVTSRLLLQLQQSEKAVAQLEPWVKRSEATARMVSTYLEALFALGRFEQLRDLCCRLGQRLETLDLPAEIRQAAQLWGGAPEAMQ